jgi:hypothetical protein
MMMVGVGARMCVASLLWVLLDVVIVLSRGFGHHSAHGQKGSDHEGDGGWRSSRVSRKTVSGDWSVKMKRAYHRLLSGLTKGSLSGQDLRMATLTSSPESPRAIQHSCEILRKRILRKFGVKIEYAMVRTSEGFGVLHIVYRGCFIPVEWLREQWFEIHRAYEVWISKVYGVEGMARYFVSQYLAGQRGFIRLSYSLRWICRGAAKLWKMVWTRHHPFSRALKRWNELLDFQVRHEREWLRSRQIGLFSR